MLKREATVDQIVHQLEKRAADIPLLESLLPVYEALLRQEETVAPLPMPLHYSAEQARETLAQGTPLLHGVEGVVVQDAMSTVWQEVCGLAAPHLTAQAEQLLEAHHWPETQPAAWAAMMEQYFRSGEVEDEPAATRSLRTFVLVHTWRPFLVPWARELALLLQDASWQHGHCPICGGQPDFAYLGIEGGERYLICARCDTEWRYKRIGCTFCNNWDTSSYGYYADQTGAYRLYACKECNRYLKVLDTRQVDDQRLLMVERIASIGMDMSALEAGYRAA